MIIRIGYLAVICFVVADIWIGEYDRAGFELIVATCMRIIHKEAFDGYKF